MKQKILEKQKFKNFRMAQGLSQGEFANKLGAAVGLIGMIESEKQLKRGVTPNLKLKFKKAFKLDFDEDVNDDGSTNKSKTSPMLDNVVTIKFYSNIQAAAGLGNYATNEAQSEVLYFDERWLKNIIGINPQNAFIIQAQGESMDSGMNKIDDIKDGDLLMVDTSKLEGNNKIYVINQNNEIRVKRLFYNLDGSLTISSNNPKYQDEKYKAEDANFINIQVLGRGVWNGSKENV